MVVINDTICKIDWNLYSTRLKVVETVDLFYKYLSSKKMKTKSVSEHFDDQKFLIKSVWSVIRKQGEKTTGHAWIIFYLTESFSITTVISLSFTCMPLYGNNTKNIVKLHSELNISEENASKITLPPRWFDELLIAHQCFLIKLCLAYFVLSLNFCSYVCWTPNLHWF